MLLARAGSPLARQDSHLLADKQSFMVASQPPIPFDQPCLVALKSLSTPHEMGIETGYDLDKVIEAAIIAEEVVGHPLKGEHGSPFCF